MKSATSPAALNSASDAVLLDQSRVSSALLGVFRGKFCNTLLAGRIPVQLRAGDVLYDLGDPSQTMFFIRKGYVKIGTVTPDGREIIYDIRKNGDVVGELCVARNPRIDRAVALEATEAVEVSYSEILSTLRGDPGLMAKLIEIFCDCLADAYDQITTLAVRELTGRVAQVLLNLADKLASANGDLIQIPAYLTQEEISQMVGARRERVSTTLNCLRRGGFLDYSSRGHLLLHVAALRDLLACTTAKS